jgi:divalent metal cation (Fe/Co/Zn/Cd) transporter
MRTPTRQEQAKERSFLYTSLADTVIVALLVIFALATGSLTLLGEAIRGVLMLTIQFYALWVLLALHRDRLARFQYGLGKMEQFVWVVIALGLLVSGLWVARTVIETIFTAQTAASPLGLTWAAIVNAINTLVNALGWFAMVAASDDDDSEVYRAQLRARFTMLISALILQGTLTAAALAKDAAIALVLDAVGAIFVTCLMLYNGFSMIARALPDLLDAPASAELGATIRQSVAAVVAEADIMAIRTRRAGRQTFAEVTIAASAFPSLAALAARTAAIRQSLQRQGAEVDLAVVVGSEEGGDGKALPERL